MITKRYVYIVHVLFNHIWLISPHTFLCIHRIGVHLYVIRILFGLKTQIEKCLSTWIINNFQINCIKIETPPMPNTIKESNECFVFFFLCVSSHCYPFTTSISSPIVYCVKIETPPTPNIIKETNECFITFYLLFHLNIKCHFPLIKYYVRLINNWLLSFTFSEYIYIWSFCD